MGISVTQANSNSTLQSPQLPEGSDPTVVNLRNAADAGANPALTVEQAREALKALRSAFLDAKDQGELSGVGIPPALGDYATKVFSALADKTPESDGRIDKIPGTR